MNEKALEFFNQMAQNTQNNPYSAKLLKKNDFSELDAEFILKYLTQKSEMLDLGSGTGLTINKFFNQLKSITAVEPFKNFTDFITKTPKIDIVNENIFEYETDKKFDLITFFGVMHYFDEKEASIIYEKYFKNLKKEGKIIVKNQFGIIKDVLIEGYSKELKNFYFSHYRHIDKEVKILQNIGYTNFEVIDIYPPECNRWANTHFYAIVCGL